MSTSSGKRTRTGNPKIPTPVFTFDPSRPPAVPERRSQFQAFMDMASEMNRGLMMRESKLKGNAEVIKYAENSSILGENVSNTLDFVSLARYQAADVLNKQFHAELVKWEAWNADLQKTKPPSISDEALMDSAEKMNGINKDFKNLMFGKESATRVETAEKALNDAVEEAKQPNNKNVKANVVKQFNELKSELLDATVSESDSDGTEMTEARIGQPIAVADLLNEYLVALDEVIALFEREARVGIQNNYARAAQNIRAAIRLAEIKVENASSIPEELSNVALKQSVVVAMKRDIGIMQTAAKYFDAKHSDAPNTVFLYRRELNADIQEIDNATLAWLEFNAADDILNDTRSNPEELVTQIRVAQAPSEGTSMVISDQNFETWVATLGAKVKTWKALLHNFEQHSKLERGDAQTQTLLLNTFQDNTPRTLEDLQRFQTIQLQVTGETEERGMNAVMTDAKEYEDPWLPNAASALPTGKKPTENTYSSTVDSDTFVAQMQTLSVGLSMANKAFKDQLVADYNALFANVIDSSVDRNTKEWKEFSRQLPTDAMNKVVKMTTSDVTIGALQINEEIQDIRNELKIQDLQFQSSSSLEGFLLIQKRVKAFLYLDWVMAAYMHSNFLVTPNTLAEKNAFTYAMYDYYLYKPYKQILPRHYDQYNAAMGAAIKRYSRLTTVLGRVSGAVEMADAAMKPLIVTLGNPPPVWNGGTALVIQDTHISNFMNLFDKTYEPWLNDVGIATRVLLDMKIYTMGAFMQISQSIWRNVVFSPTDPNRTETVAVDAVRQLNRILVAVWSASSPSPLKGIPSSVGKVISESGMRWDTRSTSIEANGRTLDILFSLAFLLRTIVPSIVSEATSESASISSAIQKAISDELTLQTSSVKKWSDVKTALDQLLTVWLPGIKQEVLAFHADPKLKYDQLVLDESKISMAAFVGNAQTLGQLLQSQTNAALLSMESEWKPFKSAMEELRKDGSGALARVTSRGKEVTAEIDTLIENTRAQTTAENWTQATNSALDNWDTQQTDIMASTSPDVLESTFSFERIYRPTDDSVGAILSTTGLTFAYSRINASLQYYTNQWNPVNPFPANDIGVEAWKREFDAVVSSTETILQDTKSERVAALLSQTRAGVEAERKTMNANLELIREMASISMDTLNSFLDMFGKLSKSSPGKLGLNQSAAAAEKRLDSTIRELEEKKAVFSSALARRYARAKSEIITAVRSMSGTLSTYVNQVEAGRIILKEVHAMVVPVVRDDLEKGRSTVYDVNAKRAQFEAEIEAAGIRVEQAATAMQAELHSFSNYASLLNKGINETNDVIGKKATALRIIMNKGIDEEKGPGPYIDALARFRTQNFDDIKKTDLLTRFATSLAVELGVSGSMPATVPSPSDSDITIQDYVSILAGSYASGISAIDSQGKRNETTIDRIEKTLVGVSADSTALTIKIREYATTSKQAISALARYASVSVEEEKSIFMAPPSLEKNVPTKSNYLSALVFYYNEATAALAKFESSSVDDSENLLQRIRGPLSSAASEKPGKEKGATESAVKSKGGLYQLTQAALSDVSVKKLTISSAREVITTTTNNLLEETKKLMLAFQLIDESLVPKKRLMTNLHTDLRHITKETFVVFVPNPPAAMAKTRTSGFTSLRLWSDLVEEESNASKENLKRNGDETLVVIKSVDTVVQSNYKSVAESQLQLIKQQQDAINTWASSVNSTLETQRKSREGTTTSFVKRIESTKSDLEADYDAIHKRIGGTTGNYRPQTPIVVHLEQEKNGLLVSQNTFITDAATTITTVIGKAQVSKSELEKWASDVRTLRSIIEERVEIYKQYKDMRAKLDTHVAELEATTQEATVASKFSANEITGIENDATALLTRSVSIDTINTEETETVLRDAAVALQALTAASNITILPQPEQPATALSRIVESNEKSTASLQKLAEKSIDMIMTVSKAETDKNDIQNRARVILDRIQNEIKTLSAHRIALGTSLKQLNTTVLICINSTNFNDTGILALMNIQCEKMKIDPVLNEARKLQADISAQLSRLAKSNELIIESNQTADTKVYAMRNTQKRVTDKSDQLRKTIQTTQRQLNDLKSEIERDGSKLRREVEAASLRASTTFMENEEKDSLPIEFRTLLQNMARSTGPYRFNGALKASDFLSIAKAGIVKERPSGLYCGNRYLSMQLIQVASDVYLQLKKNPDNRSAYKHVAPVFPTFAFKCACTFLHHLITKFIEGDLSQFPLKHYHTLSKFNTSTYTTYLPDWTLTPAKIINIEIGSEIAGFDLMPLLRDMAADDTETTIPTQDVLNIMHTLIEIQPSETGAPIVDLIFQDIENFFVPTWDLLTSQQNSLDVVVKYSGASHRAVVRRGILVLDKETIRGTKWDVRWMSPTPLRPNEVVGMITGIYSLGTSSQIKEKLGMSLETLDDRVVYSKEREVVRVVDARSFGSEFRFVRTTSDANVTNTKHFFVQIGDRPVAVLITTRDINNGEEIVVMGG